MFRIRRPRLWVELLESRDVPDGDPLTTPLPTAPPASGTTITVIDPTLSPSDPTSATLQVTITAVGPAVNGQHFSLTVTGLTQANLQPGASYQLVLGGTT